MKKILLWYYGNASIRKKLVISYLVLISIPILFLGLYSYYIARENLLSQTYQTIESNVNTMTYNLETNIQRENDNIKYLSYNAQFRRMLGDEDRELTELARFMNQTIEPAFWYFMTSDRNLKSVEVYSQYVENPLGSFLKPITACQDEAWYPFHESNYTTQWTYEDGKMFATRTLLDVSSSSIPIGIIKLDTFSAKMLEPIFQSEYLGNGVLVLDQENHVIGNKVIEDESLERYIQEELLGHKQKKRIETKRFVSYSGEILDNGWRVFYYIDKKEISSELNGILLTTLLLMAICWIVISFLISIMSRVLSGRILELKNHAEKVAEGNFEVEIETKYMDEIGVVANSFSIMSTKLNDMVKQMYQLGLEKRATELKALQAMINPHFLYNCLSSIKWKAIRAEQEEISDITGLLAKFYRTTLNNGKQITNVRNELENIRSYLELQLRTHENGFKVQYDWEDKDLEYEMPNFLLQPIVENAIVHGVDDCKDCEIGFIKVQYICEEEFLVFHIYNNGPDMEENKLDEILNTPGKGYGIYNIQERIRIYYDQECGVSHHITEEGLVCFTVKIRKEIENPV